MEENWSEFLPKANEIKINLIWNINENWLFKKYQFTEKILDFGSSINSQAYKKTIKDKGNYYGYETDKNAIKWLKQNKYYINFWKTEKTFNTIIANNVFEHINEKQRKEVIKQAHKILKPNGKLIITNVHVLNLSLLTHWQDSTHNKIPPSPRIITHYCNINGFKTKTYLHDLSTNPADIILNLLLKKYPQQRMTIEATKINGNEKHEKNINSL